MQSTRLIRAIRTAATAARQENQSAVVAHSPTLISFLTDVEGDGLYFDRFVQNSKVLEFKPRSPTFKADDYFPYSHELAFKEDVGPRTNLVYGGDVCDKGGQDLYVLRQLISLKERHPSRVHLLLGNRDINKLRILDELQPKPHKGVYWLRQRAPGRNVAPLEKAKRLEWMLSNTMGSPNAFELRRNELMREKYANINKEPVPFDLDIAEISKVVGNVTDDEVVKSYIEVCSPSGLMGKCEPSSVFFSLNPLKGKLTSSLKTSMEPSSSSDWVEPCSCTELCPSKGM